VRHGGQVSTLVGGATEFHDTSTAANGTFTNNGGAVSGAGGGSTVFLNTSTAGSGTFTNNGGAVSGAFGGVTAFLDTSTAGSGTFTNNGGVVGDAFGFTAFFHTSTAGSGTFINNGGVMAGRFGGATTFVDTSTAGSGIFINNGGTAASAFGGTTEFTESSTADSATLIATDGTSGGEGGQMIFKHESTGGTSRVEVFGNGHLDISPHDAPGVTIGSVEGNGNVFLGANNLGVGSNNMDTTFAGVIQDGGQNRGTGGSLTKIGSGTLDLTGANTYTGDTNISGGVLKVDGSIGTTTSNTFVNDDGTLAGMGMVNGTTTNNGGTVMPGDAPGTLTINGDYTQTSSGTLLINIAGDSPGQFGVLDVTGTANLDGTLELVLLNGFIPMVGDDFTFLNAAALLGSFSRIENRNFNDGTQHWDVSLQGTSVILTAEAGKIPDQAPTFLLLTLSLLGLASCRHSLRQKQA
jgi:autotransporter-associated beta strand protein